MAYQLFSQAFIIIRQDEYGRPVEIIPYNTNEAINVAVSISICRGMLRDPMVKTAFKKLAENFDPESSEAWYNKLPKSEVVRMFIYEILERFPLVFVDYSLKNPDFRACHYRRAWDRGYGFDTHEQAIVINGPVSWNSIQPNELYD